MVLSLAGCNSEFDRIYTDSHNPATTLATGKIQKNPGEEYPSSSNPSSEQPDTTSPSNNSSTIGSGVAIPVDLSKLPAYSGTPYTIVNGNQPNFSSSELTTIGYEKYSSLDSLGRCGIALTSCGKEIMPGVNEERGSIGSIKPTGWIQAKDSGISGGYLWNRCHLIGWQLSAENANRQNLITGTRYMNVDGMLPFENMVSDYIRETGNHVAYRVTPIFEGNNLVCSGVQMEAYSIEDVGEGICFNVYCYNVQPGIAIDYLTGASSGPGEESSITSGSIDETNSKNDSSAGSGILVWIPRTGSKYHNRSNCSNMKSPNQVTMEEAIRRGYEPCKKCY